jgi:hypothetical protein
MCREFGDRDGVVTRIRFVAIFGKHAPVCAIPHKGDLRLFGRCQIFQARHCLGASRLLLHVSCLCHTKSVPVSVTTGVLKDAP